MVIKLNNLPGYPSGISAKSATLVQINANLDNGAVRDMIVWPEGAMEMARDRPGGREVESVRCNTAGATASVDTSEERLNRLHARVTADEHDSVIHRDTCSTQPGVLL